MERRREAYPDVFDDVVFEDQSVAVGADAEAVRSKILVQSNLLRPLCAVVGEGNDLLRRQSCRVSLQHSTQFGNRE